MRQLVFLLLFLRVFGATAQLAVARDTISVLENGYVLKMPWAGGLNYANASNMDVNGDGKKDLVMFDRINLFGTGRFRCYLKTGNAGNSTYRPDPGLTYLFPQCANWAVLLDYNCDGKEDIFTSTTAGIKVFKNISTGTLPAFALEKNLLYTNYGGPNGRANLYAAAVGVPGIADVDNDGDLDILTFSPQGVFIEYHKNISKESGYNCDSLIFQAVDLCWGKISESQCTVTMNQCLGSRLLVQDRTGTKEYHAGSCLMCFDSDSDQDQDLIMGDISCNTVHYAHNTGSAGNANFTDTTALYPGYPNKSSSTQIKLNNFPCTYYVDADGDAQKDLVATPNAAGSENYKSVWLYKNVSSTGTVNFQFVKNNFLQDEMIETGLCAFPVTIDENADGRKDLLVGNFGYYNNNTLNARLTLYRNTGTNAVPAYSLVTRDYGNLSAQIISNAIPAVGDIDGDGDVDILVGTSTGQIHWLKNSGGAGNPCNFSAFLSSPFNFTTTSAVAAPQLFDLDGDNLLDLLIGGKSGRIAYYRNIGTATAPAFTMVTNYLGQVDVKGDPTLYGLDGYAVPFFYRENNSTLLLVGSVSGGIMHYAVPANLTSAFPKIVDNINGLNEGGQSSVLYEDLNADGKRDLMVGNAGGGLSYFSSNSPYVGVEEIPVNENLQFYPNPVTNELTVVIPAGYVLSDIRILDISGRIVAEVKGNAQVSSVDLSALQPGLYLSQCLVTRPDGTTHWLSGKVVKE